MQVLNKINPLADCDCGTGQLYRDCCQPFHQGLALPETAEKLMRSRYVAFKHQLNDHLLKTWAEQTRPDQIEPTPGLVWTRLTINGRKKGRKKDQEGWVTFVAFYQLDGIEGMLHEKSHFLKIDGRWFYLDGEIKGQ